MDFEEKLDELIEEARGTGGVSLEDIVSALEIKLDALQEELEPDPAGDDED